MKNGLAIVGAIAAALNSNFLSNTAWGLGTRSLMLAMMFFALALLSLSPTGKWRIDWLRVVLAGRCVGMGVIEGADNGAIFSIFIALFVVVKSFWAEQGTPAKKTLRAARIIWVGVFAGFMAAQSFISVKQGNILDAGTAAMAKEDPQAKARDWDFSTQWSLPPIETLRVVIPGLFGYRMDTPDGGYYWAASAKRSAPGGGTRMSGAGEYAGVLVVLVAFWALCASISKSFGVYSETERRLIWFWALMTVGAVLLAWGRHAPFYRVIYELPYLKSIRNPIKYMHPCHMSLMILFGYGLLGLGRRYLTGAAPKVVPGGSTIKSWWAKASRFEKRWTYGSFAAVALAVLSFLIYSGSRSSLEKHIFNAGFPDTSFATDIARFSVNEVGLFALMFCCRRVWCSS